MEPMSRLGAGIWALLLIFIAAGCARSGFQYLEDEGSGVYAKIPDDWEVTTEGNIDFALVGEDGTISVLPGEATLPWRAEFDSAPQGNSLADLAGAIEVQPVDRRLRSDLSIGGLIGIDPDSPDDGITVFHQAEVNRGDLSGRRIIYGRNFSGRETLIDRMLLSDDRFTTIYELRLFCDRDCFTENAGVIDEIMETFTVQAQ